MLYLTSVVQCLLFVRGQRNETKTYGLVFQTRSLPCFTELRALWYPNGTKIIPAEIYDLLTPVALAHLISGDAYKAGPGLALCTESFSPEDTNKLLNVLILKFRLDGTLRKRGKGYRIYIRGESIDLLRSIVLPHIHSSILYKLGDKEL